jgi:hypothetical protein
MKMTVYRIYDFAFPLWPTISAWIVFKRKFLVIFCILVLIIRDFTSNEFISVFFEWNK